MQRQDVALVGSMGRGSIAEGTGVLERHIQYAIVAAQVKTFVQGNLLGVLIEFPLYNERRLTLAGVHLDDTIRQVAILHRRNACDNLYGLDVRRTDGSCAGSCCLTCCSIVVEAHAIHLNSCSKRSVAFLLTTTAQSHTVVAHQRGIDSLTTRQQGGNIAHVQ